MACTKPCTLILVKFSVGDLGLFMSWSHGEHLNLHKTPSAVVFEGSYRKNTVCSYIPKIFGPMTLTKSEGHT